MLRIYLGSSRPFCRVGVASHCSLLTRPSANRLLYVIHVLREPSPSRWESSIFQPVWKTTPPPARCSGKNSARKYRHISEHNLPRSALILVLGMTARPLLPPKAQRRPIVSSNTSRPASLVAALPITGLALAGASAIHCTIVLEKASRYCASDQSQQAAAIWLKPLTEPARRLTFLMYRTLRCVISMERTWCLSAPISTSLGAERTP